jgi:hypothetical protein
MATEHNSAHTMKMPHQKLPTILAIVAALWGSIFTVRAITPVSEWPGFLRGPAADIEVKGNHVFVGLYSAGVMILDAADSHQALPIGGFGRTRGGLHGVYGLDVKGSLVYYADSQAGLQIIDIADPRQPALVGEFSVPFGLARDVLVRSNLAFIATFSGLQIVDVSIPSAPRARGSAGSSWGHRVTISGNHVFMSGENGLNIIDVSDPDRPVVLGSVATGGAYAFDVAVSGNLAFVVDSDVGLLIIDCIDPNSPRVIGNYFMPQALGVTIRDNLAFLVDQSYGLTVIDVSNPRAAFRVGGFDLDDEAQKITLSGNLAYVACWRNGVQVIDVTVPEFPVLLGGGETANYTRHLAIAGDAAFLAEDSNNIEIISIKDPSNLAKIGSIFSPGTAGIVAKDGLLFASQLGVGINIFDISIPGMARRVSVYRGIPQPTAYVVTNALLFACGASGLHIVNVSEPSNPTLRGVYNLPNAFSVAVSGTLAFVGSPSGLEIVDWSSPSTPRKISSLSTTVAGVQISPRMLKVHGSDLYAISSGLLKINVSDPANPRAVEFNTGSSPQHIEVAAGRIVLSNFTEGFQIYDITAGAQPVLVETVKEPNSNMPVPVESVIGGNFLYVADIQGGLHVWDLIHDMPYLKSITRGGAPLLEIRGRTGKSVVLEQAGALSNPTAWQAQTAITLMTIPQFLTNTATAPERFYRLRSPQ